MTVVNPKSISGINSITTGSGSDNLLTIHTSDASSTERVRINSSGDVIVGSGITVSPDGDIFATGVTTSTTFVGALTGNVTGNVTGNISGGTVAGSTGTFTGDVDIADKIVHTGDTNTAIRFPSADTVTVETAGSERLRIASDSNITQTIDTDGDGFTITAGDMKPMLTGNANRSAHANTLFGISGKWNGTEVGRIAFEAGPDTTNKDDGYLRFYTTPSGGSLTKRITIDPDGQVNVGSDAYPRKRLDITGPDGRSGASPGNSDTALVVDNEGGNGAIIEMLADNNAYGRIFFTDTDASNQGGIIYKHADDSLNFQTNAAERVSISSGGDLTISDGDLVIGTSGHGISFAATADGASNPYFSELLDDYEEGTFTPTWSGSSVTFAYSQQYGWYTKIGDTVTFHIYLQGYAASIISGNSGNPLSVAGLPFSSKSVNRYYPPVTIGRTYRMDIDSDQRIYAYVNQGSTEIKLILEQDDTVASMMTVGRLDTNTCEILLSGHYKITA